MNYNVYIRVAKVNWREVGTEKGEAEGGGGGGGKAI